jgi:ADP-ribose pyrophosphatase YjhB (NUDIX family)
MHERLRIQLKDLISQGIGRSEVLKEFSEFSTRQRATRDEGEVEHIGVYIMAVDFKAKEVYLGHHRKSNLWLPNGGHVDDGETLDETAIREIKEEWGQKDTVQEIGHPVLLSIVDIENSKLWGKCRKHYDVWYFVKVNKDLFHIEQAIIEQEFYEARWVNMSKARELTKDNIEIAEALDLLETKF